MHVKGTLIIEHKTFDVIDLRVTLPRLADGAGEAGALLQGRMHLCIDSSTKESALFIPWLQQAGSKNGELTFMPDEEQEVMKTITFEGARCVAYEEDFEAGSALPLTALLTIVCEELRSSEADISKSLNNLLK